VLELQRTGRGLEPGQLINAYPPSATKESADGVSQRAVPADGRHEFLRTMAKQLQDVPASSTVRFRVE
jgi:hypothetical protein